MSFEIMTLSLAFYSLFISLIVGVLLERIADFLDSRGISNTLFISLVLLFYPFFAFIVWCVVYLVGGDLL